MIRLRGAGLVRAVVAATMVAVVWLTVPSAGPVFGAELPYKDEFSKPPTTAKPLPGANPKASGQSVDLLGELLKKHVMAPMVDHFIKAGGKFDVVIGTASGTEGSYNPSNDTLKVKPGFFDSEGNPFGWISRKGC